MAGCLEPAEPPGGLYAANGGVGGGGGDGGRGGARGGRFDGRLGQEAIGKAGRMLTPESWDVVNMTEGAEQGPDRPTPGSMTESVAKSPVDFPLNTLTVLLSHFRQFKWLIRRRIDK